MGRLGCLRGTGITAGAVAGALLLSACDSADVAAPRSVAIEYAEAVTDRDGAAACALLARDTRERVEQVSDRDCAAGRERPASPQEPYDCTVEGG